MQRERLTDLAETLGRASALVDGLVSTRPSVPIADRPAFLVAQPHNDPQPIIERIAEAERLTFVIGAGVSMEAGLPSWGGLVRMLLESAAPGSLAREIAAWKRQYPQIQLATFNYDRLLERALQDHGVAAEAREDNDPEPAGIAVVRHLHGLLTGKPAKDAVVLTEGDYARWPSNTWQDEFMRDALEGVCVFLGLSFTDQNLLRWIYRSAGNRHVAVLSRQSTPRLSSAVRRELEHATRARLAHAHVSAYWADFYAELAQLMHEARRRRGRGRPPDPYPERAQRRAAKGRRRCLPATGLEIRQCKLREILSQSLAGVRAALGRIGADPAGEAVGLGVWGIDYDRREVTLWGASDRVHLDSSTITAVPLAWGSDWVAIEAITQGSVVEWDPNTYASLWRSVRGIPLVWTGRNRRDRIIVGAATLTSTKPPGDSVFCRAEQREQGIRKEIDSLLHDQLVRLWD